MKSGAVIRERFVIGDRIGSGAMGHVFRGVDRESNAPVALKMLHTVRPGDEARFEHECSLLASIQEPGVVRYVAHGIDDDTPWLAMEWVEGPTLSKRLREGPFELSNAVNALTHLAFAVASLHRRGVVHRDLKPANVVLENGDVERPKLVDFGVALYQDRPDDLSAPGLMIGSPGYMSPEQARGEREIDARADVFALGCVLFKCVTGNPPFFGDVISVLLKLAIEDCPRLGERVAGASPALDDLVARMLSRDRNARPRDAGEVARLLLSLQATDRHDRPSQSPPVLTSSEIRLSCIVIGRSPLTESGGAEPFAKLTEELGQIRARPTVMADGTLAVTFDEPFDSASDLATRGVRAALSMRAAYSDARIVVATGRAVDAGRTFVGQVIERASALLGDVMSRGQRGMIVLDSTTMHLVENHFVLLPWSSGGRLLGERAIEAVRELLGKPTPFVGRADEMRALTELVERAMLGSRASAALVRGAPGVGKSRLRYELLGRSVPSDAEVWTARGDPMSQKSPFGLLAQLVWRTVGIARTEPATTRWEKLRARVARSLPSPAAGDGGARAAGRDGAEARFDRVAEFLGELAGAPRVDQASLELRAARRDRSLMGDQMRRALREFLEGELSQRPLVIVLEDLHWGDWPSISFIGAALRQLFDRPLFVLGLARPELDADIATAWAEPTLLVLELDVLPDSAALELVRATLGGAAKNADVRAIVTRASGNAFFLEELVRAVAEGHGQSLPETVLATVEARLEALSVDVRRVLRAASMFGLEFWEGGVRALLGGRDVRPPLGELVRLELVTPRSETRFAGEAQYAFRHALVAETAYAMTPDEDRVRGHAAIARWLGRVGETDSAVLAEHLERGGDPEMALHHWTLSAERALEGHDLERCVALADRGLRTGPRGPFAGRLRLAKADTQLWRGQNREAVTEATTAMAELGPGTEEWCSAATTGVTGAGRLGDRALVLSLIERVLSIPRDDERRTSHVVLLAQSAIQMVFAGQLGFADELLAQMDERAGAREPSDGGTSADPRAAAWSFRARAWRCISAGDPGAYGMLMQRSAECFSILGDVRNACVQRVNVAYAALSVGELEASASAFYEVLETTTALGLDTVTSVARHNLGYALALLGRMDDAEREERLALRAFVTHGDLRMQGTTRTYLALIALMRGDERTAVVEARAALDLSPDQGPSRAIALATLASVLLGRDEARDEALHYASEAFEMLERIGGVDEGEGLIRLVFARCLHTSGDVPAAQRAIRAVADRLFERARRITPEHLQRGFLMRLPDHALTLALAEEWLS